MKRLFTKKVLLLLGIIVITGISNCVSAQDKKVIQSDNINSLVTELEQLFRLDKLPYY